MTRIEEIWQRLDKATRGPWQADSDGFGTRGVFFDEDIQKPVCLFMRKRDAKFVAHARDDIAFLLAEVERLSAEHSTAEQAVSDAQVEAAAREAAERRFVKIDGRGNDCLDKMLDCTKQGFVLGALWQATEVIGR